MSESPWTAGYNETQNATYLPEMPYNVTDYVKLKYVLDKLYDYLSEAGALTVPNYSALPADVYIPLPSGLKIHIASKNPPLFNAVDFRLPNLTRSVVHFNVLGLRYAAHLYPGQSKWVNLFYYPSDVVVIPYANFASKFAWTSASVDDYVLADLILDAATIILLASLLALVIKAGFTALSNAYDALLHSKLDATLETATEIEAKSDVLQTTSDGIKVDISRIYKGSYV